VYPLQKEAQDSSVMVSAAKVLALRALMFVASVWQPYQVQSPTVLGWLGPVGVAVAEVDEVVEETVEEVL